MVYINTAVADHTDKMTLVYKHYAFTKNVIISVGLQSQQESTDSHQVRGVSSKNSRFFFVSRISSRAQFHKGLLNIEDSMVLKRELSRPLVATTKVFH